jgi:type II secretory pathway pseudopilin PulG
VSNYHILMNLAAKASRGLARRSASAKAGYAMAGLLVALSVMAVLLSVALPAWSHMIRREREEELIFRGNQYARAINLYQRKFANASPPSLDILIQQRLLRKKFKDPLSPNEDGEFQLLYLSQGTSTRGGGAGSPTAGTLATKPAGGIVGVASKNTGQSIRVFNGKTRYNEWEFVGIQQSAQAGAGAGAQRGAGPRGAGAPRGDTRGDGRFSDRTGQPIQGGRIGRP